MSAPAQRRLPILTLVLAAALAGPSAAAPPVAPQTLSYQGLLLDAEGAPRSGPVDLGVRIYDAPAGGTLIYSQLLSAVPLEGGVFRVTLGPTGSATDSPVDPLTTSLAEALGGELGATGTSRFLEVGPDGAAPVARSAIQSGPYALQATSAERADTAALAEELSNLGGVPSEAFREIWQHHPFDGFGPPNDSPFEGLGDADGDGIANFVENDNDGDGLLDHQESGASINLVTPNVGPVTPTSALSFATTTVTVSGQHFQDGQSVQFGSQSFVPAGVTPTSFQLGVGPQAAGSVTVAVTLPNGESDDRFLSNFFRFPSPLNHQLNGAVLRLDLAASGRPLVTGLNGYSTNFDIDGDFESFLVPAPGSQMVGFDAADQLARLSCRDIAAFNCRVELERDADGDQNLETTERIFVEALTLTGGTPGLHGASLAFDAAGRPVLGYVTLESTRVATLARDLDGDGVFTGAGEIQPIATLAGSIAMGGDLALDASGRAAYAYYDSLTDGLRIAYDRSGDGDFSDSVGGTPEIATVAVAPGLTCFGVSFDDGARLAMVWDAGAGPQLGRDANSDGDFGDAGEVVALAASPAAGCDLDGNAAGGGLAVVHDAGGVRLLFDRDDDGSFAGVDEDLPVAGGGTALRVRQRGVVALATGTTFYFDPALAP